MSPDSLQKGGVVLITGASGLIGSAVARRLAERYQVIGLDRSGPKQKIPSVDYRVLDVSSPENVQSVLRGIQAEYGSKIASVIHLAAYYSFSGEESPMYEKITVKGTEALVRELNRFFEVEQFVFSSTMLVHAPTEPGEEISEDSPVVPSWPYPNSKIEAEHAILKEHGRMPVVNLRIAGVYEDVGHSIPIAQHIARIYERQVSALLFPGDASHGQAYLHLEDLLDAISLLVEKRRQLPEFTNLLLGEDDPLSYREMQAIISRELHGSEWPVIRVPALLAKTGAYVIGKLPFTREPFIKPWMISHADEHYDLDIRQARELLGWEPKRNLREVLPKILARLRDDPERWYKEHKIERPKFRDVGPVSESAETMYRAMAFFVMILGLWQMANPFTLDYTDRALYWNDLLSGFLITSVAALTLIPTLRWLRWANAGLGAWLMFAPLAFWAESAAVYSNDTLIGALVLFASGYTHTHLREEKGEADNPPGWTYNPSAYMQRLPIMFLAFIGFLLARHLAAFQLGHIQAPWEPFFGDGSERILTSDISRAFPVSDAGLGAFSYLLDVISAGIGDRRRWQTMPWMVVLFGLLIIPTGVTSIVLVMLQPIGVGEWCTVCLIASVVMLVMVPPAVDEVAASVQYLRKAKKAGHAFWNTFFFGGPDLAREVVPQHRIGAATFPISLVASCLLGTWLFFTPSYFGIDGSAAANIYISAALIVTFGVIAFSQIARISRVLNVGLGLWLSLSALVIGTMSTPARWHTVAAGLFIALLSLPRGRMRDHFGTLDRIVRWTPLEREREGEAEKREAA